MSQLIAAQFVPITPEGGNYVWILNKTGAPSIKGYLAHPYDAAAIDLAFTYATAGEPDIAGIIYDGGIPDGSLCRMVVSGWADVYVNAGGAVRGYYIRNRAAGDPGSTGMAIAEAVPAPPFSTDKHFQEVGHVFQSRAGAGLCRCIIHFN